ncbi:MAG: hypothetical protein R2838_10870 [Caldilineaceae bacterium]
MRNSVGRVAAIREHAPGAFAVDIDFSVAISGLERLQFMNVLFGNTSLQPTVQAWDMTLPPEMLATFGGCVSAWRACANWSTHARVH